VYPPQIFLSFSLSGIHIKRVQKRSFSVPIVECEVLELIFFSNNIGLIITPIRSILIHSLSWLARLPRLKWNYRNWNGAKKFEKVFKILCAEKREIIISSLPIKMPLILKKNK
jgi:hypothetical protein